MPYILILTVIGLLIVYHIASAGFLKSDKNHVYILIIYCLYGLLTFEKRFLIGTVLSEDLSLLISYILITAAFILTGMSVETLFRREIYRYISFCFYAAAVILLINQYVLYAYNGNNTLFNIGIVELTGVYIVFCLFFFVRDYKNISSDNRILIISSVVMIFSFMAVVLFTVLHIKDSYYCAFGMLFYIIGAEFVTFKHIRDALADKEAMITTLQQELVRSTAAQTQSPTIQTIHDTLPDTLKQVYDIMISGEDKNAKDIADALDISVNTARSYMSQIYSRCAVHNREEFNAFIHR